MGRARQQGERPTVCARYRPVTATRDALEARVDGSWARRCWCCADSDASPPHRVLRVSHDTKKIELGCRCLGVLSVRRRDVIAVIARATRRGSRAPASRRVASRHLSVLRSGSSDLSPMLYHCSHALASMRLLHRSSSPFPSTPRSSSMLISAPCSGLTLSMRFLLRE